MKHFDLFSGYGGFTIAGERCGFETIGFSEIDKYANAVLKFHYPNITNYYDITKIDWSEVPDFDILTGGSPCQDLSIAGKRKGLEGERSGLFYEYMRAVREKRPKYFIWENVKGALSSNQGWDFAYVLNEMAEAGYSLWWQVLNAKDFGVPQNRERIFVVGFRDGSPREVFFETGDSRKDTDKSIPPQIQRVLKKTEKLSDAFRIRDTASTSATLKGLGGGLGAKTGLYAVGEIVTTLGEVGLEPTEKGWESLDKLNKQSVSRQPLKFLNRNQKNIDGDYAFTVDSMNTGGVKIDSRIRRLTPCEAERLMGLPDGWTAYGRLDKINLDYEGRAYTELKEISDSQRYKLCGNGVVVNVVETLIKEVILKQYE